MIMGEEENASEDWGGVQDWRRGSIRAEACARGQLGKGGHVIEHAVKEPLNG